jgi:hypothetical protein
MVETEASGVGGFSERLKERIAVRLMDSPPPRYKLPWRSTYAQKCASALLDTGVAKANQLRVNFTLVWQELRWDYLEHAEFGRPFPETSDLARIANAMLDAAISVPQDSKFGVMTWRDALLILDLAMREHCKQ